MNTQDQDQDQAPHTFPSPHTIPPSISRTPLKTLILLHGRSSSGQELAEDLLPSPLSTTADSIVLYGTLENALSDWHLVFPSAGTLFNREFQEEETSWFDAASLTDIEREGDRQVAGLKASVEMLVSLVRQERDRVGSDGTVALWGISMGCATAWWVLLALLYDGEEWLLDGVYGTNGWLPFESELLSCSWREVVERILGRNTGGSRERVGKGVKMGIAHGLDDAYIDIQLGRRAKDFWRSIGFEVQWRDYTGADVEGHWVKVPEQVDDIVAFLESIEGREYSGGALA